MDDTLDDKLEPLLERCSLVWWTCRAEPQTLNEWVGSSTPITYNDNIPVCTLCDLWEKKRPLFWFPPMRSCWHDVYYLKNCSFFVWFVGVNFRRGGGRRACHSCHLRKHASRLFHSCLETFCTLFVAQTFSRSLLHCVNDYIGWGEGWPLQSNESESWFVNMFSYSKTFDKVLNISCIKKMCILVSWTKKSVDHTWICLYLRALDFFTTWL